MQNDDDKVRSLNIYCYEEKEVKAVKEEKTEEKKELKEEKKEDKEAKDEKKEEKKEVEMTEYTINDLRELAEIIIEYKKERTIDMKSKGEALTRNLSNILKGNEATPSEELSIKTNKSAPLKQILQFRGKVNYTLIDISSYDDEQLNNFIFPKEPNNIFFIIVGDKLPKKLEDELKNKGPKIIVLSLKKIENIEFNLELEMKNLSLFNRYVKGQLKEVNKALSIDGK